MTEPDAESTVGEQHSAMDRIVYGSATILLLLIGLAGVTKGDTVFVHMAGASCLFAGAVVGREFTNMVLRGSE